MKKLSVNLVVRNEEKYIPWLAASLREQTFKDFEVVIVDNASTDKTVELLRTVLTDAGIAHRIFFQKENLGFASGHNIAFQNTVAEYLLLLNADMYILPDTFARLVSFMDNHPQTASLAPRLMRWDFVAFQSSGSLADGFSDRIDSLGIRLFHNRRAIELYAGEEWGLPGPDNDLQKLFTQKYLEVFGVSGAMAIYRKDILERICLPGNNMFDPTYHSYKEDLDLAYRLRNAGYLSYILLEAVAYHDRTTRALSSIGVIAAIKNKKTQSEYVRFHSYKNHWRTLYKNEYWQNILLDWPFILWFELRKAGYLLVTDPKIFFRGWRAIFREWSYLRAARRAVLRSRRMYWKGIRRWFYL